MAPMLESDEAARRLGVKVTTLYAYVSRGLLVSHRAPDGRRSLFDMDEVERLARRSRQGKPVETRMATITTAITQLTDEGPVYRGDGRRTWPPVDLRGGGRVAVGRRATILGPGGRCPVRRTAPGAAGTPAPGCPCRWARRRSSAAPDRMRWAVVMAGALDPLRADLRPEAVTRTARRVAASMVAMVASPEPLGRFRFVPCVGPCRRRHLSGVG